jgi:hypothetical protein
MTVADYIQYLPAARNLCARASRSHGLITCSYVDLYFVELG